jgi:hypothetical protein
MKSRFSICGIRSLNPKTMEHKISPLYIYITITRSDNEEVEEDYSSNEKTKRNQQWEEQHATIKLLNIVETIQVIERFT